MAEAPQDVNDFILFNEAYQIFFTAGGKRKYFEVRAPEGTAAATYTHGASSVRTAREAVDRTARPALSQVPPTRTSLSSPYAEEKLKALLADA
ncbi:uncharacterized protein Z520_12404 [Fonsecaea multimorphosa CBS 102226]|uniref:Uncharacterized protein n=1 Tax=Fonsecaea multimorphosa CBS 102226 TaxID=1442371 RepID=A0A0D2JFC5_9EURO|nr:uncharacterized protein Z520_12404 [Fonsecaea multimorphosa CBS 102226]KIX91887.1 hypothetical protein Z520_12404 [Fonsecaea multimorphosa CBS 102226]